MNSSDGSVRPPSINAASLAKYTLESGCLCTLGSAAQSVFHVILWNVHMSEWEAGHPVARISRVDIADTIGMSLKAVQRALADLEAAGLVKRIFNDLNRSTGIDLAPLVGLFSSLYHKAVAERKRRKAQRIAARHSSTQKNLRRTPLSSQVDKFDQPILTKSPEEISFGYTDAREKNNSRPSTGENRSGGSKAEALELENIPTFAQLRGALYRVHPRFKSIAADNTMTGNADQATLADLLEACDVLRQDVGFRWQDFVTARQVHGDERTLAFFVTMTSPAAYMLKDIRNIQGYILGSFRKPAEEFNPFRSMWALLAEMRKIDQENSR